MIVFQDGQTVLHIAASAGNLETVEALLDRGCDANVQDFVSSSTNIIFLQWVHCYVRLIPKSNICSVLNHSDNSNTY